MTTVNICYLNAEDKSVDVELDSRIATINMGWGDRVSRGKGPSVYGTLQDGRRWQCSQDKEVLVGDDNFHLYKVEDDSLNNALISAQETVQKLWVEDIATRECAARAVEEYRSQVLDVLDEEYRDHVSQWSKDIEKISKNFNRNVQVEEQTVPGKCCVRSDGKLIGYADVWDGRWLGTIEKL